MAEFTDVFVYRSDVLPAPLAITEAEGVVTVLTIDESLDPGTYTLDVFLGCGQWVAADLVNWRVAVDSIQVSQDYDRTVTGLTDVLDFNYGAEVVWGGGQMVVEVEMFISGAGAATFFLEEAILRLRRVV